MRSDRRKEQRVNGLLVGHVVLQREIFILRHELAKGPRCQVGASARGKGLNRPAQRLDARRNELRRRRLLILDGAQPIEVVQGPARNGLRRRSAASAERCASRPSSSATLPDSINGSVQSSSSRTKDGLNNRQSSRSPYEMPRAT